MQRCVYPLSLVEMNSVSLIVARFRMFFMNRMWKVLVEGAWYVDVFGA